MLVIIDCGITWKLIVSHGENLSQLYDMQNDPAESFNRWNQPGVADVQAELYRILVDRMAETSDPLPTRIGIY